MFDLLNWLANTAPGHLVARATLVVLGACMWVVLICIAGYSRPRTLRRGVGALLVFGGMLAMGALHSGLVGSLGYGFVWVGAASAVMSLLAILVIGSPNKAAAGLTVEPEGDFMWDHTKTWKRGLCRTSDFCELLSSPAARS